MEHRSPFANLELYNEAMNTSKAGPDGEFGPSAEYRKVDFEQKNLERLEAMKAKRAQEQREIEEQREKTRRRQEKLKNMILREA